MADRVLAGFRTWKERHEERVHAARDEFLSKSGVVGSWEKDVQKLNSVSPSVLGVAELMSAENGLHNKVACRRRQRGRVSQDFGVRTNDSAKFAPPSAMSSPSDNYTASPKPKSPLLQRSGTVADRISEKLRQASISNSTGSHRSQLSIDGKTLPAPPTPLRSSSPVAMSGPKSPKEEKFIPPTDPMGQPKVQSDGPPLPSKNGLMNPSIEVSEAPILLSGLSLSAQSLKDLLRKLDSYLQTTPAPGVDIDPEQQTSRSKAAMASRQWGTILGTYEKAFTGEEVVGWLQAHVEGFGSDWERCADAAAELYRSGYISRAGVGRTFEPTAETHYVLKLNANEPSSSVPPAVTNQFSMLKSYLPASLGSSDEPAHVRHRRDAIKADESYKEGVRVAEEKRLEMEERIERGLRIWERWERERLGAVRNGASQSEISTYLSAQAVRSCPGATSYPPW